jgi:hypothetical protein
MDTLLCNDDGDIVLGTYQPSNTLLSLSADQYTAGSATWSDQSGNGLDFTVSTNASLKGTDADGFPYMNFGGSYGHAKRLVGSTLTNIPAPTTGKYTIFCVTQILNSTASYRTLTRGTTEDHQILIETGNNNLGLYDNNGSNFVDSGFDVTTDMTSTRNLLVWELSTTAPIYKFQLNESGTDSTINSATNYTLPFASLGGVSDSQYWGNIYEFIVYDGVLSASERAYVAEYLTHKWDISSKLPSSFTSTHGVLTNEETLAFLYAGSGTETETTYTWDATGVTYADILVVGGGGGGGRPKKAYEPGGGGGGGEVVFRQGVPVTPGVEIKVGRGGPDTIKGGISQFTSSIQANGGGRGGGNPSGNASSNTTAQPGGPGGSGGGAPRSYPAGTSVKLSVDGMGNDGGYSTYRGGGGGGGASEAGSIAAGQAGTDGGEGYAPNVFGGWNTVYGSGGGGGARSGAGGIGGTNAGNGGNSNNSIPPEAGIAHTGSGGGGGGTGAANLRPYGAPGGSGIVLVKPNPGALDGLGSSVYTQAVGAYALRRLFGAYTGPQIEIRRSLDDATSNVYFDKYGYPVNFDVETWLGGGTGYVVTWYDQSGQANDLTQTNATVQPIYETTSKRVNLKNAYMTIPGSDNVVPFSTNQPTLVQRTSMVSFKAPSNLASNQARNVYGKGSIRYSSLSDLRVWWYQSGQRLSTQHGSLISTDPGTGYTSAEVVVFSVVEENSSSSVNATSHVLRQNGVRNSDSEVTSSRTFETDPNNYPWSIGYEGAGLRWTADAYINEHMIFNTILDESLRVAIENEMQYHAIKNA